MHLLSQKFRNTFILGIFNRCYKQDGKTYYSIQLETQVRIKEHIKVGKTTKQRLYLCMQMVSDDGKNEF